MKLSALDMRAFAAIADLGGVSPAARQLGAAKSSVSRQLAALEKRLGARLFERSTRRWRLTEAGETLAAYARRVDEEIGAAEAAVEALSAAPRGRLVVSAPFSFVLNILTPRLAAFCAAYPLVRLSLVTEVRTADFFADGVDVAIRIGDVTGQSLVVRRLGQAPLVLVAAPAYLARSGAPQTPQDLANHALIELRTRGPGGWTLTHESGETAEVAALPVIETPEPTVALDLAARGHGVAVAPLLYAAPGLAAGTLVRVLPQWRRGERAISAVYPSRAHLAPKLRAFLDFVAEATRPLSTPSAKDV